MRALRVLIVADMEPNRDSGAAGTEMEVADELERQGHEVVRRWGDAFCHRIRHWNLYHLLEQPRAMRALVERELARAEFDVVQVAQPAGWLAAREHRRRRRSGLFVHRSHGFEPRIGEVIERWSRLYPEDRRPWPRRAASRFLGRLLERNNRGIVRWADAHVVSCGECADELVRRGTAREAILVSPQVTTDELLRAAVLPLDEARLSRILCIGQHVFFKAPMIAAAVLDHLLGADPSLEATWVCEQSAHEAVLQRFSPATRERICLLPWRPRGELLELFDRHGIFLFPSFTEGFGKVFLEAMARGLTVVATDQGGAHDLIEDGSNGLLTAVGDVEKLIAAVERLRGDPALARRLAEEGRRTAESYTWQRVTRELTEFYRERLAGHGGA